MKLKYVWHNNDDRGLINGRVYECHIREIINGFGSSFIELRTMGGVEMTFPLDAFRKKALDI